MENTQDVQKQLYQYRYLQDQRDYLQTQIEFINNYVLTLNNTKNTLENVKSGVNESDEILVPLGGLVNIKASIKDTQKVLVYVSNDILIEKTVEDAIEFISKLIEQNGERLKYIVERFQSLELTLQNMGQSLQKSFGQNSSSPF